MIRNAYNCQEVLSPLMARFGRRLRGERGETYEELVTTVCEALDVQRETAQHLVEALASAQLIDFERTDCPEVVRVGGRGESEEHAEELDKQFGVWSLGPRL